MRKYLLIVFIFLAGFICAGADSSYCKASPAAIFQVQGYTSITQNPDFTDYENYVTKENIKSVTDIDNGKSNPNHINQTVSFENYTNNHYCEKHNTGVVNYIHNEQFKDIKYKLYPRAP